MRSLQKWNPSLLKKEVSEGAVTEVISDDSILSVSLQRKSNSSTNCSNIINELDLNSLDVCLEKTIQSCDSLEVEMRTPTFSLLYEKLCDAIILADHVTQEAIFCYCQFGKALIQRQGEIASEKQVDLESNTVSRILNIEVKAQLPTGTSDALLRKRIEQVKKLYTLFNAIGMDKIKRIHSLSADSISKMTYEDIQYIIDNIPFDYNIHMETQLCELSSQSDKKNSDLSHITILDAPTESQVPNKSAPKKFDTKVEVIPPISQPNNPTYDRAYFRNKALDQYSNLYREFSSEKFNYYGITDETPCPLSGLPSILTDKIRSKLYKRYKKETGNEPWQLSEVHKSEVINLIPENKASSFPEQCEEEGPITFEARPNPELIIKSVLEHFPYLKFGNSFRGIDNYDFTSPQPWSSPCPICDGKHGNYGLHGSWYCKNGNQLPYDPELAKLLSQDKLEYCLTCFTSSNKFKFAIVA
ncbi:hypothetical protein C1646_821815 [Rhizophagus diaphanus]|nr:hypothetical protein C1646_821815 [Rhizophagus diaphanus] [Rhizophagus sp. MUCL 43196]